MDFTANLFKSEEKEKEYETIKILVKNGKKEDIRKFAESKGLNLNSYIKKLIQEDMNESQTDEISEEKIPIKELELSQMAEYRLKNIKINNIEDITSIIQAFGEERAKKFLGLNQTQYDEVIQKIKDLR